MGKPLILDEDLLPYRSAIEEGLQEVYTKAGNESQLFKLTSNVLEAGGKRIRPTLCLLTCEAICGDFKKAVPIAVAYELAHSASLVQDDIIDDSALRHEKQTIHKKYGVVKAILISDILLFEMFTQLAKYTSGSLPKENLGLLLTYLSDSAKLTAEGELRDTTLAKEGRGTVEEYVKVAGLKTGSLFASCSASGAVVAEAGKETVASMYEFGLNLGIAFQIRDDILDMVGDPNAIGKPILKDVQNNASNIILIHALAQADPYKKHLINSMMFRKWFSRTDVEELTSILRGLGSFDYAVSLLKKHTYTSKERLKLLAESHPRQVLMKLAESLGTRLG